MSKQSDSTQKLKALIKEAVRNTQGIVVARPGTSTVQ
jgi:hypothetical protein